MPDQVPEVFAVFQCAICQGNDPVWTSSNRSDHAFGSPGRLMCTGCGTAFKVRNGFLDLDPGDPEPIPPIHHLMQFPPIVAVYEALWRPIGYFIASKHSFPKDVDRIASLIQRKHGLILDLACGPGTVTRRIARLAPESVVVGFDLSAQMLERAVRLTNEERLHNVFYIRGSALSLPFKTESFDAVTCCGALQLFQDQDQAVSEIARVLKMQGDLVYQTSLWPRNPPSMIRWSDRLRHMC